MSILAGLPRDWYVREFNPDQPRDDDGKWTSEGGGGSSAGPAPTGIAKAVAAEPAPQLKSKNGKVKITDFEKAKIHLGTFATDKARAEKFIEDWDARVGEAPEDFKKEFLGGVDATMRIGDTGNEWRIEGGLMRPDGTPIGTYTRSINWSDKTASSDYFVLTRGQHSDVGKKILAGNMAMYQKLGLKSLKVHANIDVGGYAWAKYGYVPTQSSWRDLRNTIAAKINGPRDGGEGPHPESWDEIGRDDQERIKEAWMHSTRADFIQSEVDSWRDSGQALDNAKSDLASNFSSSATGSSPSWPEWAVTAIDNLRQARIEDGKPDFPYTNKELLSAISLTYEDGNEGRGDLAVDFDDDFLSEPNNIDPDQMNLPGIEPKAGHEQLTEEMREEIASEITTAFDKKADSDADDIDPPDYLSEGAEEYQSQYWEDSMSDREKYRWADDNGSLPTIENDDEDHASFDLDGNSDLRDLANSNDPKAVWAIADSPQGKDLLLGTDWYGEIKFDDKEAMSRFNAYVGKVKATNAAAS